MPKLSFSLPKYDAAMTQLIRDIHTGLTQQDGIFGQIQTYHVSHGGSTRQVSKPKVLDTPMRLYQEIFQVSRDVFIKTDVDALVEALCAFFTSLHSQQKKAFFEIFSQTTEAVGNVVDASGRNMWDAYIDMLKSLEMHFDKDGNHNYEMVVHPDTHKKMQENPPTPEQLAKIEETLESKRRDYYARKRSRKLS
jgi:hypothetical protein